MKKILIESVGWYGVVAILLAYVLISFSYTTSNSILYQTLNATGAIGILIDAVYAKNYQPAVLNLIWAAIACVAIINIIF